MPSTHNKAWLHPGGKENYEKKRPRRELYDLEALKMRRRGAKLDNEKLLGPAGRMVIIKLISHKGQLGVLRVMELGGLNKGSEGQSGVLKLSQRF